MNRRSALALISGLVSAAVRLAGAADPRVRVLILDGYSNHDWRLTTALIRGMLEPTGLFTVDVATAPPTADAPGWDTWRPVFANYGVIIQTCNDLGGGPSWPQPVRDAFEAYVRNGGGVYVWHGGNNAFPDWPAYNEMIGLGWRKKDFGSAIAVEETAPSAASRPAKGPTPAMAPASTPSSIASATTRSTPACRARGSRPTSRSTTTRAVRLSVSRCCRTASIRRPQMRWPLEWTTTYGRGRVYTSTFGHVWKGDTQPARMRCAGLQTVVARALQWLAGRAVTAPIPSDFPTADRMSVRPEIASARLCVA